MDIVCFLFIFFILILLYLHYRQQFDCVEHIHIYEMYYTNKKDLFLKCDIKQPIVIDATSEFIDDNLIRELHWDSYIYALARQPTLNLVDLNDLVDLKDSSIALPFSTSQDIMQYMPRYISMNNDTFLKETGMLKSYKEIGQYFKPNFTWTEEYDICYARETSVIPFQYHTSSYKFICILRGSIVVKMTEFRHCEWLKKNQRSPPPPPPHIEIAEIELGKKQMLYIPPYCMYSIFFQEPETCFCEFQYETVFHWLSHTTHAISQMCSVNQ